MIKKERTKPIKLQKLEPLLNRLPKNHPARQQAAEELAKVQAGYRGELAIDYYLNFLPESMFYILHDLRLPYKDVYRFQMDTLLISPYLFINLEVKNIQGSLYFDTDFHQLIRTLDEKETGFKDPILQAALHRKQLELWLKKNHFPPIPIISLIIISNPSSIIKAPVKTSLHNVLHAAAIPDRVSSLLQKYPDEKILNKELNKLSRLLIKQHLPSDYDPLETFHVKREELLTGVYCPECSSLSMKRISGSWQCPNCKKISKDAHLAALREYALLFGPFISNKEFRAFLNLSSMSTAQKLLKSLNLETIGSFKNRKYNLTDLMTEK